MKFKSLGAKTTIIGIALAVGIAIGTLYIYYTTAQAGSQHVFPKNQNGQTYGSQIDATSPETEPDLISAVGVGGVSGYVKHTDLDGEVPKTPEEAIALTKKNKESVGREIPLYAVDGQKVIGSFKISAGRVKEITQKEAASIE